MDVGIISVILMAFILAGMLWGLIRGWKNSLIRLLEVVLCAFLAYFIAGSLADAFLSVDLTKYGFNIAGVQVTTIEETLANLIGTFEIVKEVIEVSPTLKSIIAILPLIIISLVLFIVLFFVIKFFVWIIHAIVGAVIRKKLKEQSEYNDDAVKRKNISRLIGAGVGVLQGIVCFAIVMCPISGVTYFLADEVRYIRQYSDGTLENETTVQASVYASEDGDNVNQLEVSLQEAEETLNAINRKFVGLTLFGYKPIAKGVVNGLTSFELNGVETSLTDEIDNVVKIYVRADKLVKIPIDSWTTEETATANEIIDLFFESPITGDITSEAVKEISTRWTDEDVSKQSFLGINKPRIEGDGQEVLDVFLRQLKADEKEDLKNELKVAVNVLDVAIRKNIINIAKSSTTIEDVIIPLSEEGVVEELIGAMVGGRAIKNSIPTAVQFGLHQMYPMLGVREEAYANLKISKASSEINWDAEKVYLDRVFCGLARTYLSLQKEGNVLEKLDYHSLALALENLRKSELLNSTLDNGSTLGKEITLVLLKSTHLEVLDGIDAVLNEVETSYENINFDSLLGTLKSSVELAQSMKELNSGEISELPKEQVTELLNGLTDDTTGKLVKDLTSPENLAGLGVDGDVASTVGSLIGAVVDYNTEVNASDSNENVAKMPTDEVGITNATEAFKDLADVVQTGVKNENVDEPTYRFFESKEELKSFILNLQKSPYVYSVSLSSSSTLGFKDDMNNTKLTDVEYGYLQELISEDSNTFKRSEMEKLFGYNSVN